MTRPRRDTAKASPPPQAARRQGHLDAVLTSYDHHQHQPPTGVSSPQSTIVSGLLPPINIPGKSTENSWEGGGNTTTTAEHPHDNSSNNIDDDIDRGRSLTLGSEFDLGWDMTGGGRDERGLSFSGLLTPLGDPIPEEIASTTTVVSTYTSASTEHPHPHQQNLHAATSSADGIADTSASSHSHLKATNQGDHYHPMHQQQQQQHYDQSQQQIPVHHHPTLLLPARSRGDSTASASQFLNELYSSSNSNNRSQFQIQQQRNQGKQQQQHATSSLMSHTPPTQMGSSYENSHFGKRMRAGVSS